MTYAMYNAINKLANHLGITLSEKDVHLIKPLEGRGSSLNVYGVATIHNGIKTLTFYCADYGCDRFKSVAFNEQHIKIRQCGDATLVGSKVIGW